MRYLVISVAVMAMVLGLGAFITMEPSPMEWSVAGRALAVAFWGIAVGMIFTWGKR